MNVDVDDRGRVETRLESDAWVAGQQKALQAAVTGASLDESLKVLLDTAREAMGDVRCAFYVADRSGRTLHHVIGMCESYAAHVDGFRIAPDSLSCGRAVFENLPVVTADVGLEPRWKDWLWLAEKFEFRACWSFPMESSPGKVIGTLAMYFKEAREATARDYEAAGILTRAAALIISLDEEAKERKRAEQKLRQSEQHKAFLLRLGDALRQVDDPVEIQGIAMELLREQLNAGVQRTWLAGAIMKHCRWDRRWW